MIKGVRTQAINSSSITVHAAATFASAIPLLTIPSGKTFILTDLACAFTTSTSTGSGMMLPGVALFDVARAAGTIATAGQLKVGFRAEMVKNISTTLTDLIPYVQIAKPLVITDLQNGPEFTTCVSAGSLGTWTIPTYGLWIGGILR